MNTERGFQEESERDFFLDQYLTT